MQQGFDSSLFFKFWFCKSAVFFLLAFVHTVCWFSGYSYILEGGGCEDEMAGSCVLNEPIINKEQCEFQEVICASCNSMTVEVFANACTCFWRLQREKCTGLQKMPSFEFI